MKVAANTTRNNISKVELLLLTYNCPKCLGDTQMSSRGRLKKKEKGKSSPLVLHNTQLCMGAGRGRCEWSSQCLQVILFIIQMKTLFHYPWGSNVFNVPYSWLIFWCELTARRPSTPQMMTKDRERVAKKQVIASYLHFTRGDSPPHISVYYN